MSYRKITKKKKIKVRVQWGYLWASMILLFVAGGVWWGYENIFVGLPNIDEVYNPPKLSSRILDKNGKLLYQFYQGEDRSWTPMAKIPQTLVWATVAIEDKDFYNHHGISVKGMINAIYYDVFKKNDTDNPRGGSTITQQLVKNIFLSDEKSFKRKVKEAVLSVMIENKLTKEEILERYFNQVGYGGETYGVEEAAVKYFGKNVEDLDLAESAFLAGLPAAPSSYSPFGDNPNFGYLRQKHVIEEMEQAGFIDQKKADLALAEKLNIVKPVKNIVAPHFVFYVKDYLINNLGFENFDRKGLTVITSLDGDLQQKAEAIVKDEVNGDQRLHITNGAALVTNPQTGEILAMVGSKDYFAKDIDGKYNVTTALRQPGSSIKPINYLLALTKGWTLASVIEDEPVTYQIAGQKPYEPQDYTGRFLGQVTLRTALASSLNVPSVKLLAQDGIDDMIDLAQAMGITTWNDRSRFGLALALGSGEVKMTDMATAYGVFANMGTRIDVNPIVEVKDYLGKSVYKAEVKPKLVADSRMTFLINNALSDNNARAPVFGLNSKLRIDGKTVAVKTGTTNSLKDNWCIGWTKQELVAAWVGNNDSSPMSWVASGVSGATPIWNRIMTLVTKSQPNDPWAVPEGVNKQTICGREEYFINGTGNASDCITAQIGSTAVN